MYFLEMAHLGEKRSWLSAEEVLEELDEPIMPDSDDDLEDLQMDETDDDERCTIESVFQELSPLFNPDCPPSDSQDCPTLLSPFSPSLLLKAMIMPLIQQWYTTVPLTPSLHSKAQSQLGHTLPPHTLLSLPPCFPNSPLSHALNQLWYALPLLTPTLHLAVQILQCITMP